MIKGIDNYKDFLGKKEKICSVILLLVQIGKVVKKISDEEKSKETEIPWHNISGMRDVLLHEYFKILNGHGKR
ncbi:MAG: DUF86 domain-containing protein [Candidatus Goldbacteria bacterium]|nr:DUF86 domain-containing protein [Candidatus Goldiibacteriota bacterium]